MMEESRIEQLEKENTELREDLKYLKEKGLIYKSVRDNLLVDPYFQREHSVKIQPEGAEDETND